MVKVFSAPCYGQHAWKQFAVKGLNGLLVGLFLLVSACTPQLPAVDNAPSTSTPTQFVLPSATASLAPSQRALPTLTSTPTNMPLPATNTPVPDLQGQLNQDLAHLPTGEWGVFIENLATGQTAAYQSKNTLHPASTVKTYLTVAMLYWLDKHPDVKLTDSPKWDTTHTYQEILQATLGGTDEITTGEIYRFLNNQAGFNAYTLAINWGAKHTMFGPRQSTAEDLGLLLKRLYHKEILSDSSRQVFFSILQSPDHKPSPVMLGIPDPERNHLVDKSSSVFTESLNIMATTALFSRSDCAYTITILTNKVEPLLKDQAAEVMTRVSKDAFYTYCGLTAGETLATLTPTLTASPTPVFTATTTETPTPLPPTPTFTVTPTLRVTYTSTPDTPLTREVNQLMSQIPVGISGAFLKNLKTGEFISVHGYDTFHIASSIKIFVGMSFFAWLDNHPEVNLKDIPDWDTRSYHDLLVAMLVESDEGVTAEFYNMLDNYGGFNPYTLARNWGAVHTDIGNRQSTPADVAYLFERLNRHEILSERSRQELLAIMRTHSPDRELPALVKGLPDAERPYFADKNGLVFEDLLNVIADAGYYENGDCAFTVVVVTNKVDPAYKTKIDEVISGLSDAAYRNFCRQTP
jgi:beta-lactamase class A